MKKINCRIFRKKSENKLGKENHIFVLNIDNLTKSRIDLIGVNFDFGVALIREMYFRDSDSKDGEMYRVKPDRPTTYAEFRSVPKKGNMSITIIAESMYFSKITIKCEEDTIELMSKNIISY